jgi:broad specificity phosphatase PhoE
MNLVLVRHGETLGESAIRLNGWTDVALAPLGVCQMERVGASLRELAFEHVIASPLRRSRESASLVRPGAAVRVVEAFREVHFGRWETLTWEEAALRDPEIVAAMRASRADFTYPEGESRREFRARIHAAAHAELDGRGDAVAVLHKGVIKTAIAALTGMSAEEAAGLPCELGSIARLERNADGFTLVAVNETAHLGQDRAPGSV